MPHDIFTLKPAIRYELSLMPLDEHRHCAVKRFFDVPLGKTGIVAREHILT